MILDDYLTRSQAARELRKCPATLDRWRRLGYGPDFVTVGRDIYYKRTALTAWLAGSEQVPA